MIFYIITSHVHTVENKNLMCVFQSSRMLSPPNRSSLIPSRIFQDMGKDNIPVQVLREKLDTLLPHLHKLFTQCCQKAMTPQDIQDDMTVTLYKTNGNKDDLQRGVSCLSITGKAFPQIILKHLQKLT